MNSSDGSRNDDLRLRLLVVDEDPSVRQACIATGEYLGFVCDEAASAEAAFAAIEKCAPSLVIAGLPTHELAEALLAKVKETSCRNEMALMTDTGRRSAMVDAIPTGAYDAIEKPLCAAKLRSLLQHMAEKLRLVAENDYLRARINAMHPPDESLIGQEGNALSTTALADLERITILRVFERAGRDKALAGKMLGISRATLYRKLKQYHVVGAESELETVRR